MSKSLKLLRTAILNTSIAIFYLPVSRIYLKNVFRLQTFQEFLCLFRIKLLILALDAEEKTVA